jgi:hypothetical protein
MGPNAPRADPFHCLFSSFFASRSHSKKVELAGEEDDNSPAEMPMIRGGGAAERGAVWSGEHGMLPGPFRGSYKKDVEYEKIQPSLVAAWRHFVIGGDGLQELRQLGQ